MPTTKQKRRAVNLSLSPAYQRQLARLAREWRRPQSEVVRILIDAAGKIPGPIQIAAGVAVPAGA